MKMIEPKINVNCAADNTDMKPIEPKINVNCDCCTNTDYATKTELENAGWRIEPNLQLCPLCRFD
jgi:hypothetical protein